ncbi:Intracellular protein transport protein USO1 [Cladobotryum mycophilum]|uniref:Intracellular protein transport protein USO1 n=1 Tax=Cladobotryum mycophilum TaxID=491253 RepID=A0ABR0SZ05_9HYPO
MFSIPSAPAKQSVGDTITVLSGRLGSATLLEDRRAAILGLRSFAKDFPASVASGALRSLISSLSKDGEDVDTVKIVLETLLMLFSPNEQSPEASDEIALWLADEFTQRQENITLLLDFLDSSDFYSRLYSLQLLGAILSARTERTEECVFTAPLGISRLVSVLDDQREAIRNEGISLLISLTPTSVEIQKLVAFENAYERIFAIIVADGSLSEGGRTVEDCLILLANLLRRNPSNQSLFRESGCIIRLAEMLGHLLEPQGREDTLANWAHLQRNRNLYAFLSIIRLFLPTGSIGTSQNQHAFWRNGLSYLVLQLAFSHELEVQIKAEAMVTCGDMIRNNATLQEGFAQLMVHHPFETPEPPATPEKANGHAKTYVIDGLLELTLNLHDQSAFDLRFAACECLKAYFSNHSEVRLHFLSRAIEGFQSGRDDSANVLAVLLNPSGEQSLTDPYRDWFAAVIAFHLLYDNPIAKARARGLTEGDASKGEEVVTSVQTITAHVLSGIRQGNDARVLVGHLMLLLGWLFEDLEAVNDFLAEGSNVQSLIQIVSQPAHGGGEIVQGLSAMLLGFAYEFSTKDSSIPRATLHSILTSRLDRENYLDRLAKLRNNPLLRDFEVTPQRLSVTSTGEQVDVYFDNIFVDFFKDTYSRVSRAIDRNPEIEISVVTNGIETGISRELVDSLRDQVEEKGQAILDAHAATKALERSLHQEQASHRQSRDEAAAEVAKIKASYEKMRIACEGELSGLQNRQAEKDAEHETHLAKLQQQLMNNDAHHKAQLVQTQKIAEAEAERLQQRTEAEMADLRATISRLEVDLVKATKSKVQEIHALQMKHIEVLAERDALIKDIEEKHNRKHRELQKRLDEALYNIEKASTENAQTKSTLEKANKSQEVTQSELDDLLIVFGDLEDKVAKYKARLRELDQTVSDGEEEDDEEDDDDEEEDDGSSDEEDEKAVD